MTKLLILLVSMVGLAAAGVLDTRWLMNRPTNPINEIFQGASFNGNDFDPIEKMSLDELMRQKFLLMILDHVHQPKVDESLCQGSNTFVLDENKYKKGLDGDMVHVMQLLQDFRLLGKNEVFSISDREHVRQMSGLNRILVQSGNWETFKTNLCCARKNMNGVLFVNALLLALRERNDTRMLVIPSIHEILPEMYLDKDIIRTARNVDMNLLATTTDKDTVRPNLLEMIGLGGRNNFMNLLKNREEGMVPKSQMRMPWREMRMQMTMQKTQNRKALISSDFEDKIVLPVQKHIGSIANANLLTDDVGLKGFFHLIINDLCLRESELKNMQLGRVGINSNMGMTILERESLMNNNNNINMKYFGNVDTDQFLRHNRIINADRYDDQGIGKENGKFGLKFANLQNNVRFNGGQQGEVLHSFPTIENNKIRNDDVEFGNNFQGRLMNIIHGSQSNGNNWSMSRVSGNSDFNTDFPHSARFQSSRQFNNNFFQNRLNRLQFANDNLGLPTTSIDDERLVHVNRRRLSAMDKEDMNQQQFKNVRDRFMNILHKPKVNDGRHTEERNDEKLFTLKKNNQLPLDIDQRRVGTNFNENLFRPGVMMNQNNLNQRIAAAEIRNKNLEEAIIQMIKERDLQDDFPTTNMDNDRLLHINRRQLLKQDADINNVDNIRENRFEDFFDVLRAMEEDTRSQNWNKINNKDGIDDEAFMGWQNKIQNERLSNFNRQRTNDDDSDMKSEIRHRRTRDTRTITSNSMLLSNIKISGDVLLHNIKQVLTRVEMNEISLGLKKQIMTVNQNLQSGQSRRGNAFTDDELISIEELRHIENSIQLLFENVNIGSDVSNPISFDRKIANILLGQEGNINILSIIRDIVASTKLFSGDIQSLQDLGIDLKNPLLQIVLQRLNKAIDVFRTEVLGAYTKKDLSMDGVTINNVFVDQLMTCVDSNDIDILNLLGDSNVLSRGGIKTIVARQQRLNHKDFTIKFDLDSNRNRRVVIRTMLGPKLTDKMGRELSFEERRQNFMLIDTNIVDLQIGKNLIKQKSRDIAWTASDTTPLTQIYKHVIMTLESRTNVDDVFPVKKIVGQDCRFPHRLLLPRGRVDGMEMQLLVIVTPLENEVVLRDETACAMGVGILTSDRRSLGFPLDRRIDNIQDWISLPNIKITDVVINHDDKINV